MARVQSMMEEGIERVKEEEAALERETAVQTCAVRQHFEKLVQALRDREQQLTSDIEEEQARKRVVLARQREGLERTVLRMESGGEHARRTALLEDDWALMQAHGHIMRNVRGLRHEDYDPYPTARASIQFVSTSEGDLCKSLEQHGRVTMEANPASCVAEGEGLRFAYSSCASEVTVRTFDHWGRPCSLGGQRVEILLIVELKDGKDTADTVDKDGVDVADVANSVRVKDWGDGRYTCSYVVKQGTREGSGRLEVRVN